MYPKPRDIQAWRDVLICVNVALIGVNCVILLVNTRVLSNVLFINVVMIQLKYHFGLVFDV